jgi:putative transposase
VRELVLKIARENGWGYTRVLGELKKLGVHTLSRTTVKNILREAGLDPGPKRGADSWDQFIKRHAATLWASDFVSVRALTASGFVELDLLFFIHLGTRRVIVSKGGLKATYLLIDNGPKFTDRFNAVFDAEGCEVKRVGPRAPNMSACAERWVQSRRAECLDHFLILSQRHLHHLVTNYVEHYNLERPHQSRGNVPLPDAAAEGAGEPRILPFPFGAVKCRPRLGGLLKHYYRDAA